MKSDIIWNFYITFLRISISGINDLQNRDFCNFFFRDVLWEKSLLSYLTQTFSQDILKKFFWRYANTCNYCHIYWCISYFFYNVNVPKISPGIRKSGIKLIYFYPSRSLLSEFLSSHIRIETLSLFVCLKDEIKSFMKNNNI